MFVATWHGYFLIYSLDTALYFAQVGGQFIPSPGNYSVVIALRKQLVEKKATTTNLKLTHWTACKECCDYFGTGYIVLYDQYLFVDEIASLS